MTNLFSNTEMETRRRNGVAYGVGEIDRIMKQHGNHERSIDSPHPESAKGG